jgi:hypothetical protein
LAATRLVVETAVFRARLASGLLRPRGGQLPILRDPHENAVSFK